MRTLILLVLLVGCVDEAHIVGDMVESPITCVPIIETFVRIEADAAKGSCTERKFGFDIVIWDGGCESTFDSKTCAQTKVCPMTNSGSYTMQLEPGKSVGTLLLKSGGFSSALEPLAHVIPNPCRSSYVATFSR